MPKEKISSRQKDTMKKVMRYIQKYRGYLILSVLLAAVTVAATLYIPILIGDAVDFIVEAGKVDFIGLLHI